MADNVTDADREAARRFDPVLWSEHPNGPDWEALVQAFANHRTQSVEEATRELVEALAKAIGTSLALVAFCERSGVTDDLMAELFPETRKRNGQPCHETVKEARRTLNEAKRNIAVHQALLTKYQSKTTNKDREHDTD